MGNTLFKWFYKKMHKNHLIVDVLFNVVSCSTVHSKKILCTLILMISLVKSLHTAACHLKLLHFTQNKWIKIAHNKWIIYFRNISCETFALINCCQWLRWSYKTARFNCKQMIFTKVALLCILYFFYLTK